MSEKNVSTNNLDINISDLIEILDSDLINRIKTIIIPAVPYINLSIALVKLIHDFRQHKANSHDKSISSSYEPATFDLPVDTNELLELFNGLVIAYNVVIVKKEVAKISESLSKIANFLDTEYQSKVQALTAQIEKMTKYQSDIIADDDRRKAEIIKLDDLEHKCIVLLGQANLSIESLAEKKYEYYEDYRDNLYQADKWYGYQKALFEILYKIEELRYTFYMGAESMESCFEIMSTYVKQIKAVQKKVKAWHTEAVKKLEIDMEKNRRKRDGWDAAFHWVPSLFDDESNYANMKKKTVKMIQDQQEGYDLEQTPIIDAYSEGVRIIVKDDKYYYLPEAQNIVE